MSLIDALLEAHHKSALRGNCSHQALAASALGSGDYFKSIAATLLTLGGLHGPIFQAYDVLMAEDISGGVARIIRAGHRVPGWGNGFVRGEVDPLWTGVQAILARDHADISKKLDDATASLHRAGKLLFPNPAAFTAATALALGIPRDEAGKLFIQGRLSAWTSEYARMREGAPCLG